MQHIFVIPIDEDTQLLDKKQKDELCDSIVEFTNSKISENRVDERYRYNIESEIYRNIRFNLLNSVTLIKEICNGIIDIKDLPWYEPYKLDNTLWTVYIDRRNKNRETKENMATVKIYKCRKCGGASCTSYDLQTRSIDEPMTRFISCKICGNEWKTSA
jgi:DNA-directed RNA polymerase subunit M/transcription elongation factor TFIIS